MPNTPPDHETLERVLKTEPNRVLNLLPDCTATRSAKRNLEIVYAYAKEAREQIRPE
jgi:hypothetical protein